MSLFYISRHAVKFWMRLQRKWSMHEDRFRARADPKAQLRENGAMEGKRREKSSRLWRLCELRLHPPYCAPPTLLGEEQLHTSPPTVQSRPENTVK